MVRSFVLGNQSLLVNIDRWLQVRDIFFPRVGQFNHLAGYANRIAVLEGGATSWVNESSWEKKLQYVDGALVTDNEALNHDLQLSMKFKETVCADSNIFLRKIRVRNFKNNSRSVRICFHHDFNLYGDEVGDTAFYHPTRQAIIHYKRAVYFLMGVAEDTSALPLSDFNIGEHVGPEWDMDANPIAQGEVESIFAVDIILPANEEYEFTYYLTAGKNLHEVYDGQDALLHFGARKVIESTEETDHSWLQKKTVDISKLPLAWQKLYDRSLLLIKTQSDRGGAIMAANDSHNRKFNKDTYSYLWPRDGALVSIALIKAGFYDIPKNFFLFCKDILYHEGCLLHKYNPDKTLGSSWHPWVLRGQFSLPIQEDESALVLYALRIYYEKTGDKALVRDLYLPLVKPIGDFLAKHRYESGLPKESYDLWEERRAIFTFTTAAVLAGLRAADILGCAVEDSQFCNAVIDAHADVKEAMVKYLYCKKKEYFRRGITLDEGNVRHDDALDSSVYGLFAFGVFDVHDEKVKKTMQKVKDWLENKTRVGGFARYNGDYYHARYSGDPNVPGNPWFICTLWYAKYLIKKARSFDELKMSDEFLEWVVDHALETGVLSEQIDPYDGHPISVGPLTWSHAEFIDAINDYVEKQEELSGS